MTTQEENRQAMQWLLGYHDKLEIYKNLNEQFKVLGAMEYSGMPGGTTVGNPTLSKATTLLEIEKYKNWLMVIELVESMLSDKSREFLRLWRLAEHEAKSTGGRPGWYDQVRNEYAKFFENKYGKYFSPSNQTLKNWKSKLVEVTVRLAIRKGCL